MVVLVADWPKILQGKHLGTAEVGLELRSVLRVNEGAGTAGAFLAKASDGLRYWVKPLNNLQAPRVCYTEVVLSRLGLLVGAPVCRVVPIVVPTDFDGYEFESRGTTLQAGIGSASAEIEGAIENRELKWRSRDNNSRRQAGVLAMFLWLGGGDHQWLYVASDDHQIWSHDHGHYLPGGLHWSAGSLEAATLTFSNVGALGAHSGLDTSELDRLADALDVITEDEIASSVGRVPGSWPVSQSDKAALCKYVDHRRTMAAIQLRQVSKAI